MLIYFDVSLSVVAYSINHFQEGTQALTLGQLSQGWVLMTFQPCRLVLLIVIWLLCEVSLEPQAIFPPTWPSLILCMNCFPQADARYVPRTTAVVKQRIDAVRVNGTVPSSSSKKVTFGGTHGNVFSRLGS